ncbi:Hypothetical protein PHPALM_19646 [Phytophthora palmivora]|uniref:Uncharacterized protein n=1 Tax=Phytophthora palmivora TaxID=4796 RepID=A0A2P4XGW1_9STRA|nr:Hypothetical protein PHPALM_19646 [Phytophthora palmivora]
MIGDVSGAFRHIPVHADSVHMFAFIFEDLLVIDLSCRFDCLRETCGVMITCRHRFKAFRLQLIASTGYGIRSRAYRHKSTEVHGLVHYTQGIEPFLGYKSLHSIHFRRKARQDIKMSPHHNIDQICVTVRSSLHHPVKPCTL